MVMVLNGKLGRAVEGSETGLVEETANPGLH